MYIYEIHYCAKVFRDIKHNASLRGIEPLTIRFTFQCSANRCLHEKR